MVLKKGQKVWLNLGFFPKKWLWLEFGFEKRGCGLSSVRDGTQKYGVLPDPTAVETFVHYLIKNFNYCV